MLAGHADDLVVLWCSPQHTQSAHTLHYFVKNGGGSQIACTLPWGTGVCKLNHSDRKGPDVHFGIIGRFSGGCLAFDHFRRHPVRRAYKGVTLPVIHVFDRARAEIGKLDCAVFLEEEVACFHVTVVNPAPMGVVQRCSDLFTDATDFVLFQAAVAVQVNIIDGASFAFLS